MAAIKLFGLGARKQVLSPEEFHDHWRHPHGTWARLMTNLRGYVQSHQIHSDLLGASQSRFELVAEIWLDTLQDLREFRQDPILLKYLVADEPTFIDIPKSVFMATEEEIILAAPYGDRLSPGDELWSDADRPVSIKMLHIAAIDEPRTGAHLDTSAAQEMGALRYVRCHPLEAFHGQDPPFGVIHEFWWPTVSAFHRGIRRSPTRWGRFLAESASAITLMVQAERLI